MPIVRIILSLIVIIYVAVKVINHYDSLSIEDIEHAKISSLNEYFYEKNNIDPEHFMKNFKGYDLIVNLEKEGSIGEIKFTKNGVIYKDFNNNIFLYTLVKKDEYIDPKTEQDFLQKNPPTVAYYLHNK